MSICMIYAADCNFARSGAIQAADFALRWEVCIKTQWSVVAMIAKQLRAFKAQSQSKMLLKKMQG